MIGLDTVFWIFIFFFTLIGALRGWAKEVVASAGLVLSIFTLRQFGNYIVGLLGMAVDATAATDPSIIYKRQFWVLSAIHLFIAFFSYQGPTLAAAMGNRLRPRDNVQEKLLGGIIGALNGYLIVGTIYSFLEYRVTSAPEQFARLAAGVGYPFDPSTIQRPADVFNSALFEYLPLAVLQGPILPLLMVVLFLVVLIAII